MQKSGETVEFIYNENGLRVQKTAISTGVTKYTLHGKNIHHMTQGSNELHFFYDAQNKPAVVVYNGTPYSYVKNLQGDIVVILDSSKNVVVSYVYDAWCRPISCSGTMANTLGKINPFRYRGYVYDEETGLYYLRNRYYNAIHLHFLNTDHRGKVFTILGLSSYCYCRNRPITRKDLDGTCDTAVEMGLNIPQNTCTADFVGNCCADEIIVFPETTMNPHKSSGGLIVDDATYELVESRYAFITLDPAQADQLEDEFEQAAFINSLFSTIPLAAIEFAIFAPLSLGTSAALTLATGAAKTQWDWSQIGTNTEVSYGHYYVMVAVYKHPEKDVYQMYKSVTSTVIGSEVCHHGISGINFDSFDWEKELTIQPFTS